MLKNKYQDGFLKARFILSMVRAYLVQGSYEEEIQIENDHEAYLAGFLECMPNDVEIEEEDTHYDHAWIKYKASGYEDDEFIIY